MKNNNFKKLALLCAVMAMNATSFAISTGGAVAAGVGSALAVGLIANGISKNHKKCCKNKKNKQEHSSNNSRKAHAGKGHKKHESSSMTAKKSSSNKKELRAELNSHKQNLKKHKVQLHKLEKKGKGSTPEALGHKSMIEKLESAISDIKNRLKNI